MYCRKCGREIADDAKECPVCGAPTGGTYRSEWETEAKDKPEDRPEESRYGYSYSNPGRYVDPGVKADDRRGMAIASMVLGIVSLMACCVPIIVFPTGLAAVIMGVLGLRSSGKGFAVAGIVLGVIAVILGVGLLVMSVLMFSNVDFNAIINEMDMYY